MGRAWHPVTGHWVQLSTGEPSRGELWARSLIPFSLVRVPRGHTVPVRRWRKIWGALRPPKGCAGGQGELRGGQGRTGEEIPCPHREPWPLARRVRLCRTQLSLAEVVFVAVPLPRVTSGIEGHLCGTTSMGTWIVPREKRNRGLCPPAPSWCSSVPKTRVNA